MARDQGKDYSLSRTKTSIQVSGVKAKSMVRVPMCILILKLNSLANGWMASFPKASGF